MKAKAKRVPKRAPRKTAQRSRRNAGKARGTKARSKTQAPADAPWTPPAETLPEELTGDTARRVWRETRPALEDRMSLLEIDQRTLILYCNAWQLLKECQDTLACEGRYITMEDTGYVTRHPAAIDEAKAVAQIRQLASELGMSPKSRRGVKVRSAEGDPLKQFLQERPRE